MSARAAPEGAPQRVRLAPLVGRIGWAASMAAAVADDGGEPESASDGASGARRGPVSNAEKRGGAGYPPPAPARGPSLIRRGPSFVHRRSPPGPRTPRPGAAQTTPRPTRPTVTGPPAPRRPSRRVRADRSRARAAGLRVRRATTGGAGLRLG